MSSSSPQQQQQQQQQRQRKKKRRHLLLLYHLLPPTLSLLFLHKFSTSFFLAKRSLPHTSSCSSHAASDLLSTSLGLSKIETDTIGRRILSSSSDKQQDKENGGGRGYDDADDDDGYRDGCWMPRRVASLAVIVVDALRFDFATSHLPKSVGARIAADESSSSSSSRGRSRLLQFVADPPTVTMQRLKGLTTGGLPTFADISKNFGGADIDEDSWVQQMVDVDVKMRGVVVKGGDRRRRRQRRIRTDKMAFVGDDTWVDLFPVQFSSSHPYPSFNTRDLDTVDDGCLFHLPRLLQSFGKKRHSSSSSSSSQKQEEEESYEVVVVHFLGVDHVGHTYGPHDEHMTTKLSQMDDALERILNVLDESEEECQAAFVFGDHGMTEDGNHGGGTPEEVNAGLFAHFSPGCGDMSQSADISGSEIGSASFQSFSSIHQIDLVPTISILLGLPIPYANMGSLVTSLLPPPPPLHNNTSFSSSSSPLTATALALNAAQVWNYLSEYSRHSNAFPPSVLKELKEDLDTAVTVYRSILGRMTTTTTTTKNGGRNEDEDDAMAWREAAGLFKIFLSEANAHGRRVWTTFDSWGMMWGGGGMVMIAMWDLSRRRRRRARCSSSSSKIRLMMSSMESIVTVAFMTFTCVLLPFSNSYIMAESHIVVMTLAVILLGLSYQRRRLRQYAIITIPSSVVIIRPSLLWKSLQRQQQHLTIPSIIRHHYNLIMGPSSSSSLLLLLVAVGSRCHELIINGHGADASLRRFVAHHPLVFGTSLLCLTAMRYTTSSSSSSDGGRMMTTSRQPRRRRRHALAMVCLAYSWWEKRFAVDGERKGHGSCGVAIFMGVIGLLLSLLQLVPKKQNCVVDERGRRQRRRGGGGGGGDNDDGPALPSSMINNDDPEGIVFDLLIIVMAVTGPSAASSAVVFLVQLRILRYYLLQTTTTTTTTTTAAGSHEMVIPPMIMAALFHLVTRHAFFATNHACAFNHLQTSAAFVVTDVFYYIPAGGMLFLNTFGWEMMGMVYLLAHDDIGCNNSSSSDNNADDDDDDDAARRRQRMRTDDVWEWFVIFQEIQTLGAVVAVSLMRRHLMVWAIFAPKFVFECVFWILRVCFVFVRWRMMMMVCYDDNEAKNSM